MKKFLNETQFLKVQSNPHRRHTVLGPQDVAQILYHYYDRGKGIVEIQQMLERERAVQVGLGAIYDIVRGRTWTDVFPYSPRLAQKHRKLAPELVVVARKAHDLGVRTSEIRRVLELPVTDAALRRVFRGETWKRLS